MPLVYASPENITITMTSLASGSWRQSASVSNAVNLYLDALIGGSIQVGTSPTNGSTFDIYAYGTFDAGTNFTAGASGTNSAYTADGEEGLFPLLRVITVDATSNENYVWGPVSLAAAFGGWMPVTWGVVVNNNTGVITHATGTNNKVTFQGVKV